MPTDDYVRPSTLSGTKTPISVSHKLVVEIRYEQEGCEARVLRIGKDMTIASVSQVSASPSRNPLTLDMPPVLLSRRLTLPPRVLTRSAKDGSVPFDDALLL